MTERRISTGVMLFIGLHFNLIVACFTTTLIVHDRQAKMHADHKQYQSAFQLCNQAAEKYISALDLKFNYFEALYNWANTLRLQSDLPLDCWTTEFSFAVTYFLEVFRMASIKRTHFQSAPVIQYMRHMFACIYSYRC